MLLAAAVLRAAVLLTAVLLAAVLLAAVLLAAATAAARAVVVPVTVAIRGSSGVTLVVSGRWSVVLTEVLFGMIDVILLAVVVVDAVLDETLPRLANEETWNAWLHNKHKLTTATRVQLVLVALIIITVLPPISRMIPSTIR